MERREYTMPTWLAAIVLRFFNMEAKLYGMTSNMMTFRVYYQRQVPVEFKLSKKPVEELITKLPVIGCKLDGVDTRLWLN
jgi:hypothetical protein